MKKVVRQGICLVLSAGLSLVAAAYDDEYISTDGSPTVIDLGGDLVYVFSNKADVGVARTVTAQRPFTLKEALLVGGGGGGGNTMGGGGGGGQVLHVVEPSAISAGGVMSVTVGVGGAVPAVSKMLAGDNGGTSVLTLPDGAPIEAYGGGGAGGFSADAPGEADGHIGSGGGSKYGAGAHLTRGTYFNYGNPGGGSQGGGGGAASPGEAPGRHAETVLYDESPYSDKTGYGGSTKYRLLAGYGGEGLTNFISGVGEVYGSGGGGGGGQYCWSQKHAPGGTHAGSGATRTDISGGGDGTRNALPADEGFGAGGGGGSYAQTGSGSSAASSKGGCGTVILRIVKSAPTFFSVGPVADVLFDMPFALSKPAFVSNVVEGVALVEGEHYTLSYDCGELTELGADRRVTVTVSGREGSAYDGYVTTLAFTIKPNRLSVATIPDQLWQGSDVCPVPAVTDLNRGTALTPGQGFTVAYANNGQPESGVVTATATVTGEAGSRYAGIVVEVPYKVHAPTFTIAEIPSAMFLGVAIEPSVTVTRDFDGVELTRDADFTVAYAGNADIGTAMVTATGKPGTIYAGYSSTREFAILAPAYQDDYIKTSDGSLRKIDLDGESIYVFTNVAAETVSFVLQQSVTLLESLLVGGGGGGGSVIGGGGGGGGVLAGPSEVLLNAGEIVRLRVGAGGAGGATKNFAPGANGEHTTLTIGGVDYTAFGGGGGAGYNTNPGSAAKANEIGSAGGGAGSKSVSSVAGVNYNPEQGHAAGSGNVTGGGGAGENGKSYSSTYGGRGGEGLVSVVTGVREVYGSGGGAGGGKTTSVGGLGGTHAGRGYDKGTAKAGEAGEPGFGGGGGGGVYKDNSGDSPGGAGGSGTVVLRLKAGDFTANNFEIAPIADVPLCDEPARPSLTVRNRTTGEVLTEGTDYGVAYADNDRPGWGIVTVTGCVGSATYAGHVARSTFRLLEAFWDENLASSNLNVTAEADSARSYYTFTKDSAGYVTFMARRQITLETPEARLLAAGETYSYKVTSGTTALVTVLPGDRYSARFHIEAVSDQLYIGTSVTPALDVRRTGDGAALAEGTDYDVYWQGNDGVGTATVVVSGRVESAYADLYATRTFRIIEVAYEDGMLYASAAPDGLWTNGFHQVYSFADATAGKVALRFKETVTIDEILAVGGGGAGGSVIGGGGGAGALSHDETPYLVPSGAGGELTVGAGGTCANSSSAGSAGAVTTFACASARVCAYGGGGGAYWTTKNVPAAANPDEIASGGGSSNGGSAGTAGVQWNADYGNGGGASNGNLGGGGGGCRGAGGVGTPGAGATYAITGESVVYARGGKGGDRSLIDGTPGAAGTGNGGDGGGYKDNVNRKGGDGGSGCVHFAFVPGDYATYRFDVLPIPDQHYEGAAVEPNVDVWNPSLNVILSRNVDYTLEFADNTAAGTGSVTARGKAGTPYAGWSASATFTILPTWFDDFVVTEDMSVRSTNVNGLTVYIFTNTAETVRLKIRQNLTLKDALVVGGGGAGGNSIGGGGGGGGVTTQANERVVFAGRDLMIRVGAGGRIGTTGTYPTGLQGGTSSVTFADGSSLFAYGGGGGGGNSATPSSSATGEIASGGGAGEYAGYGSDGLNWNSLYGNHGSTAGGGGSARAAATNRDGAEGVTNAITGIAEVYGSGGGGGLRNSGTAGRGGTNAGSGTDGYSPVRAESGVPGFGGGGGGGGYYNNSKNHSGGDGGSGTVILAFVPGGEAGQPTITAKSVTYPDGITQPKVSVTLGNATSSPFNATVTVKLYTAPGEILDTLTFSGVVEGQTVAGLGRFCVDAGVEVFADVTIESDGAEVVYETMSAIAVGETPAYYGHGGGARVIHVLPGATGRGDGTSWFDAYTDFRLALKELSAERPEVWFAGDETVAVAKTAIGPSFEVWIRGGFTGLEDRPGDRAKGAMSLIDSVSAGNCFDFANANAVTLDGFDLRRGQSHNLTKSGKGDLTVTNCVIGNASGSGNGRGVSVSGESAATVRFADVRFTNLFGGGNMGANSGTAAYFGSLARVFIDDCAFLTNGCSFGTGYGNTMYQQSGAAIYASGAPLTVRNTRFAGNRSQALQGGGGVIRLGGNCGATAFTNCTFVGNETIHAYQYYDIPGNLGSLTTGMFVFSPSAGTLDLVNCTFAHGVAEVSEGAAGVSVRSGTANVLNCIFFGNTNGVTNTAGFDIDVVSGATANIAYSLFEDDAPRRISCAEGGTTNCTGLVYGNPLFVTDAEPGKYLERSGNWMKLKSGALNELCTFNVHLRGGAGYCDEGTGLRNRSYARQRFDSPAIDAGDPAVACVEPVMPQIADGGGRVNLGAYGNTPWATMTRIPGAFLRVR